MTTSKPIKAAITPPGNGSVRCAAEPRGASGGAAMTLIDDLRDCVAEAACADVVNRQNRVAVAHRPAGIDDFLSAPLHFRVAALDGCEV